MGSPRPLAGAARFLLATIAVALVGCGGGGAGSASSQSSAAPGPRTVAIADYSYKPATITVAAGTKVTFSNHDSTAHTATSKQPGGFETDAIQPGKSASVVLEKPGTYTYYCLFHPFMKGTIVVK